MRAVGRDGLLDNNRETHVNLFTYTTEAETRRKMTNLYDPTPRYCLQFGCTRGIGMDDAKVGKTNCAYFKLYILVSTYECTVRPDRSLILVALKAYLTYILHCIRTIR